MVKFLLALVLTVTSFSASAGGILSNEKYDADFRIWSAVWNPGYPWQLLKAQCWQESRLNPLVVSPVGAKGLCQFMDRTHAEVVQQTGFSGSPFDPELNIMFASYYMMKQRQTFSMISSTDERTKFSLGGYNAGAGNILKSWKLCGKSQNWETTKACLVKVTGRHHKETIGYVDNVLKYYIILILDGG